MQYFFIDIETVSLDDLTPLEVAFCLTDSHGNIIHERDLKTNIEVPRGHISLKTSGNHDRLLRGHRLRDIADELSAVLNPLKSTTLVMHNASFDMKAMKYIGVQWLYDREVICTMSDPRVIEYLKLPVREGGYSEKMGYQYKMPKLPELYEHLFKREINAPHHAYTDMNATRMCFFELKRLGVL